MPHRRSPLPAWMLCLPALAAGPGPAAAPPAFPGTGPLPDGLGTNIHFTDPADGEMKMIAAGGFRWLRMDFSWSRTERKKGVYDFSPYDRLVRAGEPCGLRFLFILDYSNRLYESERSVRTAEGRAAFARWAAAAVRRYRGRGILWEMWNEPNLKKFWGPEATADDYIRLAKAVGEAIAAAAPEEFYVGPATSGIPLEFLEQCFRAGLLKHWRAVSVHPYRQAPPETVAADYRRLRALIRRYAPPGRDVPILSGEWGYSATWRNFDEDRQGRYLPRQWLTNLACRIPLSIWYDWHDDGTDPHEPEHHFGTVRHARRPGKDPLYEPKPAYLAARTLTTVLRGFRFSKRLPTARPDDFLLLFARGRQTAIAAWTGHTDGRACVLDVAARRFRRTGHLGDELAPAVAKAGRLRVELSGSPVYLLPDGGDDLLAVAAAWQTAPPDVLTDEPAAALTLHVANPLERPIRLRALPAGSGPVTLAPGERAALIWRLPVGWTPGARPRTIELDVAGLGRVGQMVRVESARPLVVRHVPPAGPDGLYVEVGNPSGRSFAGRVVVKSPAPAGSPASVEGNLHLAEGQKSACLAVPWKAAAGDYTLGIDVLDARGRAVVQVPPVRFRAIDDLARYSPQTLPGAWRLLADGDAKVAATVSLSPGEPPGGGPLPGLKCLRLAYDLARGWKFVRLAPVRAEARRIPGRPGRLGLWLWGDGSGHLPRMRFRDSTGQTFQPTGEPVRWKGWRYVTFPLDGRRAGHWGGVGDGRVHWPVTLDTLLLMDKSRDRPGRGEVCVAAPTLEYDTAPAGP